MEALTYSKLVTKIQNYCERDDPPFISEIPSFIALAEYRIASEQKPFGFVRTVEGSLQDRVFAKPARWRKTKNFSILVAGETHFLKLRTYEYLKTYCPDPTTTGTPEYYADYDFEHFVVANRPDNAYPFELQYYELPSPLSEENQTNWTTQYAPSMLLYATLMEAMPFLKTSERIPEFQGLYDRALAAVTGEDQERVVDSSNVRSK